MSLEGFVEQQEQRNPGWFQPGVTLNPGGKPKSAKVLSDALRQRMSQGAARQIADRLVHLALSAKQEAVQIKAAELIYDRLEGKAMQAIQISQSLDENTARRLVEIGTMLQRIMPSQVATIPAEIISTSNHAQLAELSATQSDIKPPEKAKRKYVRSGKYVGVAKQRAERADI